MIAVVSTKKYAIKDKTMKKRILKIRLLLIVIMSIILLAQCKKISRSFYVSELDICIYIEEIEDNTYRINIYKTIEQIGQDYIEVNYQFSEMPTINMNFPHDDSSVIYVIDRWGEVKHCKSTNFKIVNPDIDRDDIDEMLKYVDWCNSLIDDIPSYTIQINGYLRDLIIWEPDKYMRKISSGKQSTEK